MDFNFEIKNTDNPQCANLGAYVEKIFNWYLMIKLDTVYNNIYLVIV